MDRGTILRRLRGALGNAVMWGAGWFAASLIVFTIMLVAGLASPTATWMGAVRSSLMFGVMGGITGTVFATFIGLRYRGYQLSRISWVRFGLGGAIVTGLFVPGFITVMRFISGDPFLAWSALLRNGGVGFVFGGAAAAATLRIAQLASARFPDENPDEPAQLEGGDRSAMAEMRSREQVPRSR